MKQSTTPFWKRLSYFGKSEKLNEQYERSPMDRSSEKVYRRRWQHDKVVRTTHGVNCTGSCSWKVHVKDGIIAWETQQTDYPSTGPGMPEYEPRGCPRGASFSWYTYSPHRVRYPYIRSALLSIWAEALAEQQDPVKAWKSIVEDPDRSERYKTARGKGGFVRTSWDEIHTLISSSIIHTIQTEGPDRIFGFSPIPAMSMVSYAGGARFLNLIGAPLLSFYDWYADLPPASPQVWGDQTDVPESSDWYNSSYLLVWGSNIPQTRTPDSHFMIESRYKGTKVVAVAPDYAEYVKFADTWLPVEAGMDAALGMSMTHVILKEYYVDQQVPYFMDYVKKYTDLPFLITLDKHENHYRAGKFLRAENLGMDISNSEWKTVVYDHDKDTFAVPNGTIGHRWEERQTWNLHLQDTDNGLGDIDPALSMIDFSDEVINVSFPDFVTVERKTFQRPVPVKKVTINGEEKWITTVFDLVLASTGVARGLEGEPDASYTNEEAIYTPAWQEKLTGVPAADVAQIAREFAQNAIDSKGRSMIIMGSGINHWYHSDMIYRTILNLVMLTGCQGVNGGGWAHYVGQEKVRPLEGFQTIAMAKDWGGPPRLQNGTSFFYFATEQWRYEDQKVDSLISPLTEKGMYEHLGDYNSLAARLGWLPSYPQFNKNPITLAKDTVDETANHIIEQIKSGDLKFAIDHPENPVNFPKLLFVWRANLIGSSAKGHEYFLKHLLGTHDGVLSEQEEERNTNEIQWIEEVPKGKLDLLINYDFRMSGTGLYSDIVLPAATWYEKHDLSSTDMHPFVHPFNPAIATPWESRSDWDSFKSLAKRLSEMAKKYLPDPIKDVVATPLQHDTKDEISQAYGTIPDWKHGEYDPVPGVNFPRIHLVERDYTKVYEKFIKVGSKVSEQIGAHGLSWPAEEEYDKLGRLLGKNKRTEDYHDLPSIESDRKAAEAILSLSSATNGSLAIKAWETLEKKSGQKDLTKLVIERAEEHITFNDITVQPRKVLSTPVFTGTETGNRRYSPFTINIEHMIPFRTLTGRQHFYLDHDVMLEFGEELPTFKPPLQKLTFYSQDRKPEPVENEITLRYLTPHFKWSYHSTYGDTLPMLTLFRGGPHVWLNNDDAESVHIKDNDWIEMYNRNGVVVARAVVSHRIPRGIVYMYHVQDRLINVPGSKITKTRGGTFNSPTRIHIKPTQMIGGYAQLSYGFNYYGPTGNQRDEQVKIRRMDRDEVDWLED
ncbi:nitrate reductase subunit alpha [Ornithinibacillus gellani]|uniref:nitrate reductase subunit alpha n=1 Tax=Ornithinibacillus gellani TaxID=2293253 RepID=UPI000F493663|nr:nitrate reductase subunit alpha [Ornithinibacillus gellani]TQS74355.1 nitrate reductase subunit alpha [Ornithinibacillus gellani]